jgi:hypothetical protein
MSRRALPFSRSACVQRPAGSTARASTSWRPPLAKRISKSRRRSGWLMAHSRMVV